MCNICVRTATTMSGLGMGHITCGYDSEKDIFTRHINWRKKKGMGVSPSLETDRYGIGENYCNSLNCFKKIIDIRKCQY